MIVMGSQGSEPGTPLPPLGIVLPLDPDPLTSLVLGFPSVPGVYEAARFLGCVPPGGRVQGTFWVAPGILTGFVGFRLTFAAVILPACPGPAPPPQAGEVYVTDPAEVAVVP